MAAIAPAAIAPGSSSKTSITTGSSSKTSKGPVVGSFPPPDIFYELLAGAPVSSSYMPEPGTTMESIEVFSKSLSKGDVVGKLSIPVRCLKHFSFPPGENSFCFNVVDSLRKSWCFTISIRGTGYPKPVISGDWTSYVRAKGVKVGDIIFLYKHIDADGEVQYSIKVTRKIFNILAKLPSFY